jgi:hypothetical protein
LVPQSPNSATIFFLGFLNGSIGPGISIDAEAEAEAHRIADDQVLTP